jgi:2-keto-4-pentenoate hydratase
MLMANVLEKLIRESSLLAPDFPSFKRQESTFIVLTLRRDWQEINLAVQPVRLLVNGDIVREGSGAAVLGDPLNAWRWLAQTLSSRGLGLKAGQYISTGVTTDVYMAELGDRITADFGPVGSINLEFN